MKGSTIQMALFVVSRAASRDGARRKRINPERGSHADKYGEGVEKPLAEIAPHLEEHDNRHDDDDQQVYPG